MSKLNVVSVLMACVTEKQGMMMQHKRFTILVAALYCVLALATAAGCLLGDNNETPPAKTGTGNNNGGTSNNPGTGTGTGIKANPIPLTVNTWADGSITSTIGEQWFKFTATASTQYLHVSFGTLTDLYVQLYDSNGGTLGSSTNLYSSKPYTSLSVVSGQTYYVRVTGYGSKTGTYRIGFNTIPLAPGILESATTLTSNTWVDGTITSTIGEQWFKFTATASTQYLHVSFGTLTDLYVKLYDSNGGTLGDSTNLYNSKPYTSLSIVSGQTYYVRVTGYGSKTGTYRIGFNAIPLAPGILESAATLTSNTWANGTINAASDEQWFEFTATASTQYLHVSFGTLTDLYVKLYDSNGGTLGDSTNLYNSKPYTSLSVVSGQTYYVRVTGYGSKTGTYRIGFNTSTTAPPS